MELLPADAKEVAVRAATSIDRGSGTPDPVDPPRGRAATRAGTWLPSGRFSDPPQLGDLKGLSLDDDAILIDLSGAARASAASSSATQRLAHARGDRAAGAEWKAAAQQTFRAILLARAGGPIEGDLSASVSRLAKRSARCGVPP